MSSGADAGEECRQRQEYADRVQGAVHPHIGVDILSPLHNERGWQDGDNSGSRLPGRPEVIECEQRRVEDRCPPSEARQPRQQVPAKIHLLDDWRDDAAKHQAQEQREDQGGPGIPCKWDTL
jgi:hypothetical protein